MREFVGKQGSQVHKGGHHARGPVRAGGLAGRGGRQDAGGEAPGDQGGNDQQAPVQPHVDASDAAKAQVLVHVTSVSAYRRLKSSLTSCKIARPGLTSPPCGGADAHANTYMYVSELLSLHRGGSHIELVGFERDRRFPAGRARSAPSLGGRSIGAMSKRPRAIRWMSEASKARIKIQ